MNIWRLITHHEISDEALVWYRKNHCVCIGWHDVGNIQQRGYQASVEIGEVIRCVYPTLRNSATGGPTLWNFYHRVKVGDLILLRHDGVNRAVAKVTGNYSWKQDSKNGNDPLDGYPHLRSVKFISENPQKLWDSTELALGENQRWTLAQRVPHKTELSS